MYLYKGARAPTPTPPSLSRLRNCQIQKKIEMRRWLRRGRGIISSSNLRTLLISKPFQALPSPSKTFQAFPSPAMSVQTMFEPTPHYLVVESLADQFRKLLLADPIEKALWEGKLLWGDILCTPEEEERERVYRKQCEAEETAERAAAAAPALSASFFRGFSKPSRTAAPAAPAALERDVPAFPAGRLTLMAKNLPRDIDVKELRIIFEQYGPIRDIYIPKNMDKSSPYYLTIKGFALIKFLKPDDSARAFAAQYALVSIRGKNIALEPASADR